MSEEGQFDLRNAVETREKDKKTQIRRYSRGRIIGFTVHEFSVDKCRDTGIKVPVAISKRLILGTWWCIAYNCGSKLLTAKKPRLGKSLITSARKNERPSVRTCDRSYQNRGRIFGQVHAAFAQLFETIPRSRFPMVKPMKTFRVKS